MRRWIAVAIAALSLGIVAAASAHPVYQQAKLAGDPLCVYGSASIAEGPDWNGGQAFVEGWYQAGARGTRWTAKNMPPGYALVKRELYRWNGYEWRLCANSGWLGATDDTSYIYRARTWTPMPCGNNSYYGISGASYAWMNGQWHGGYLWSGYHFI